MTEEISMLISIWWNREK